jgi:hypothetical protein
LSGLQFDTPVLENELQTRAVDVSQTPYFFNDGGVARYLTQLPSGLFPLTPAPRDPQLARGYEYPVPRVIASSQSQYGVTNELDIVGQQIAFEPMWATRENAAAFGITLVEPGQAVRLESPVNGLCHAIYQYGVFAGHWSPYQNTGQTMLSVVCTDLEHHDFPHIFLSADLNLPLVTSVGRYWPGKGVIRVADLWVPQGHALYIPAMPAELGQECIDLHNNRNSAYACWGEISQNSILTQTLLQTENPFFYWYWNATNTVHSRP